jgi:hypothetical protein
MSGSSVVSRERAIGPRESDGRIVRAGRLIARQRFSHRLHCMHSIYEVFACYCAVTSAVHCTLPISLACSHVLFMLMLYPCSLCIGHYFPALHLGSYPDSHHLNTVTCTSSTHILKQHPSITQYVHPIPSNKPSSSTKCVPLLLA